ncbi:hypothetical protein [Mesorhizobium sp. STM 4661]|uniref:hypothetical protein n=1 Tax=Mesorhizobium sp. STM 4661 TaxID=1297570 RepID=UPI0018DED92C|nr:hypothetical protein [Mesorhizobium sp. STM 4661]
MIYRERRFFVSQGDGEVAYPVPDFQTDCHTETVGSPIPGITIATNHLKPLNDFDHCAGQDEEKSQFPPMVRPGEISGGRQHGKRNGMIKLVVTKCDSDTKHLPKPLRRES